MFKAIHIQNFRGFRDFELHDLGRMNLLVGRNGTGKTTLLEAVFLLLGAHSPEIPLRLNTFRGLEPFSSEADETWGWLFTGKSTEEAITVKGTWDDGANATLTISLRPGTAILRPPANGAREQVLPRPSVSETTMPHRNQLHYEFAYNKQKMHLYAEHSGDRVGIQGAEAPVFPVSSFLSVHAQTFGENAKRFEKLEEDGRDADVIEALKVLEPRLKRLSSYTSGEHPALRADIGIGRLIPIAFLGEGFVKTATMVCSILTSPGGCVLVDEFDNGLHYSALEQLWSVLGDAARKSKVQLIATTHSRECVAAADAAAKVLSDYDLSVYRLERAEESIRAIHFTRETLDTALDQDWEVR